VLPSSAIMKAVQVSQLQQAAHRLGFINILMGRNIL
jgi:hypothetical protein